MQLSSFIRHSITKQPSIVNWWLVPHLGSCQLEDISPSHVAGLLDKVRESGASDSHVRGVLQALRSVMQQALLEKRIFQDPTQGFKVKVRQTQVTALTAAQRDALDVVLDTSTFHGTGRILRVMLWTGLRISEALALRCGDYDSDAQVLTVRSGKSDAAARRVDVPDCVAYDLECLPFVQPHQTTLRRALSNACVQAGVPPVRVHDLRHTRITTLLMAGVPVGYVSKQAGHANPATTLRTYDHWIQVASQEQRRAWANS